MDEAAGCNVGPALIRLAQFASARNAVNVPLLQVG